MYMYVCIIIFITERGLRAWQQRATAARLGRGSSPCYLCPTMCTLYSAACHSTIILYAISCCMPSTSTCCCMLLDTAARLGRGSSACYICVLVLMLHSMLCSVLYDACCILLYDACVQHAMYYYILYTTERNTFHCRKSWPTFLCTTTRNASGSKNTGAIYRHAIMCIHDRI
jgi:hypothetical protein